MRWLERQWAKQNLVTWILLPLSALFGILSGLRRACYRLGILAREKLPVPVIVVGNISVGGTGKTPLVLWLANMLTQKGLQPGIISRGYGGDGRMQAVTDTSTTEEVGDEPVLLARRAGVPVYVGPRRVHTARRLLSDHPACDIIISDDGLQHYALERDLEIAVVDAIRGFGNGFLLPAGPLRETVRRLAAVDAIVSHGGPSDPSARTYSMSLRADRFVNVADPSSTQPPESFRDCPVRAIAAIGHPERFFQFLRASGVRFDAHPFPDHHPYVAGDLEFAGNDIVLMTEKDAVKCAPFAKPTWWYLPVNAQVDHALGDLILNKIRPSNGQ